MPIYSVKFPDGTIQNFDAPKGMNDVDVVDRAIQERSIKEGKIQTTWFGGATKQASQEPGVLAPAIAGAGMAAAAVGAPAAVASGAVAMAPLAARWLKYASQKYFGDKEPDGQEPAMPSPVESATLAAAGLAGGYGAKAIGAAGKELGALTRAHQLPNGQWVPGLKGAGVLPWAGRTMGEVADRAGSAISGSPVNPEAVSGRVNAGVVSAFQKFLGRPGKPSFSAAEVAKGIEMLNGGVPPPQIIKTLIASRGKP